MPAICIREAIVGIAIVSTAIVSIAIVSIATVSIATVRIAGDLHPGLGQRQWVGDHL